MAAIKLNEQAKPFSLVGVDEHKHALANYGNKGAQLLVINTNDAQVFPADSFPKMQERAKGPHFVKLCM